jgi:hypothetical protein
MDEKGADGYFAAINALFPDFSALIKANPKLMTNRRLTLQNKDSISL